MHDHNHGHAHGGSEGRLGIAFFITAAYMVVEAVGGFAFNSLALLADAGHMFSDVMALGLSWLAIRIGKRSPTDRLTFGFRRSEILAALINGLALWAIVAVIFYEAVHRFSVPSPVQGKGMFLVAGVGLVVNLVMAALLFRGRNENLNIKGAFLHIVSDALGSAGAVIAAIVIIYTGRDWVDPLVSILIGFLVLYSSWGLVKESVLILMEGVPSDVDLRRVEESITSHEGVCCVYDLHVWSITSNRPALSAHVVMSDPSFDRYAVLTRLNEVLEKRFGIEHTTIQIESTHEMKSREECSSCRMGTACAESR
jgi:cobalt-zinc-cadmium efflux system protein